EAAKRPAAAAVVEQGPAQVELATGEARVGLVPDARRRATVLDAGVGQVDEVAIVQRIQRYAEDQRAAVPVQAEFGAVGGFVGQLRVAELVTARGHVQAVGIQLFRGRRALCAVEAERQVQ